MYYLELTALQLEVIAFALEGYAKESKEHLESFAQYPEYTEDAFTTASLHATEAEVLYQRVEEMQIKEL